MDPISVLAEKFKEFPGIGERQAKRFVYFLLHKSPSFVKALGDAINSIKNQIAECISCHVFFQVKASQKTLCDICSNPATDKSTLLVVEKDADMESIKRTKNYKGMYFVLGGLVPIVTKETPTFVRTNELLSLVKDRIEDNTLKEIILGLSINPHGEHTDLYLRELLHPIIDDSPVSIVSLGRGLSTGTELEYSDSETIKNALKNRG
jgi:recombination protein RecR